MNLLPGNNARVGSLRPLLFAEAETVDGYPSSTPTYKFTICAGEYEDWDWCEESSWQTAQTWRPPAGSLKWATEYYWGIEASDGGGASVGSSWYLLLTGVEQPGITSNLAAGTDGREFNHMVGNYTTSQTDASVPGAGPSLSVSRSYNSLDPRTTGLFGAGWSTLYDMRLEQETGLPATLLVTMPSGEQMRFADNGDGTFQPPPGEYLTLATVAAGGWRLMDKSGISYVFDSSGRLSSLTDQHGRGLQLTYTTGNLSQVTSTPSGRHLTFTWSGVHVASVSTDSVNGAPLTWNYTYTGDTLTQVCAPVAAPNCTTYAYGTGSHMRSTVLNSDAGGYWRLGESSGATAASAVATNFGDDNATYSSGITYGVSGALTGTSDTAVRLAGSSYVQLPDWSLVQRGGYMSAEAWFKTTGSGVILGYQDASITGSSSSYVPAVYVGTDGKLRGQFWQGIRAPITSAGTVNNGAWHQVVLSGSGNSQTLYLDGQVVGTLSGTIDHGYMRYAQFGDGIASSSWPSSRSTKGRFGFTGDLDEVALFNSPMTLARVKEHYAARLAAQQLTSVTLPSGKVWASNTYNVGMDRLATHTDRNGGLWQLGLPAYSRYVTGAEALITVTDPKNNTIVYGHDPLRGMRLYGVQDQSAQITWHEFDTGGFMNKIIDRNGLVTDLSYDERGNVTILKRCRSGTSCHLDYYSYYLNAADPLDPRNDQLTVSRDGRSASETDNTYATKREYTSAGELAKVTTPVTLDFPSGRSTTYTYTDGTEAAVGGGTTPAGLPKTVKQPNGAQVVYHYKANGDLADTTDRAGLLTRFGYDALGRTTSQTVVSAAQPAGVTISYAYDGLSRVTTTTAPGVTNEVTSATHTAEVRTAFDADGNPTSSTLDDLTGTDPDRVRGYTYDTFGRIKTVTDPEGGVTQYSFDVTGALISSTSPIGTVLQYGYTPRGEKATVTLKAWTGSPTNPQPATDVVLKSYAYDPEGRPASETDAMGRTTRFTYWDDNLLSQKIADDVRLNGSTTTRDVVLASYDYDWANNPLQTITGGGKTRTDYVYDAANRLTSQTLDPTGLARTTSYGYDADGNVVSTAKTATGTSRIESVTAEYDNADRLVKQITENGATDLVSTWKYDDRGLVTEVTSPPGNASGVDRLDYTTLMRYDPIGQLVESKQPPVAVERAGGAPATQRPTVHYGYNTAGERTGTVDPEGRTSSMGYDRAGRMTTAAAPAYTPPGGTAITPTTGYTFDAAGRPATVTDPRGNVTTNTYDALDRLVRVTQPPATTGATPGHADYTYTLNGELLSLTDPTGARTEATYDDLGRQVTSTVIERKPTTATLTSYATFDDAGNLLTEKRPGGDTTTATVNPAGETTELTDPLNHTTSFAFDLAGRQTKVTDPLGQASTITYDLAGRATTVKDLDATSAVLRTRSIDYDLNGNPTSRTDAEGHTTTYDFDALGRIKQMAEPVSAGSSITTSSGYDAAGARTRYTDGRGNATITTYNSLGLAESVIEPSTTQHPNAADRTWTTAYDATGNPVSQLQPGGVTITNTFDNLGRVTQQAGSGGGTAPTAAKTFGYDLAGRPTSAGDLALTLNDRGQLLKTTKGGVDQATFAYDANGRLAQRGDAAGTTTFTWDGKDRLKTAVDPLTGVTISYGYDTADRLTSTAYGTGGPQRTYGYDALNRPTSDVLKTGGGAALASITYGYDKEDRLTSKVTSGTAGAGSNSYAYDFAGRLTSWTNPASTTTTYEWDAAGNRTRAGADTFTYNERNRLTSGAGIDYTYTPRGTLTSQTTSGATRTYSFDAFDRMVSDGNATYDYDALDRMTSRTKAGTTTKYLYADTGNDLAAVTDNAGTKQETYSRGAFGDVLSSKIGTATPQFQMADLHGDIVAGFTAGATSLAGSAAYSPFGQVTATGGARSQLGFQGEWTDADTGEVNMYARWYQPGTGTFASRDSVTLDPVPSAQANRYAYGLASPLIRTDPTGHVAKVDIGADGVCHGTVGQCDAYFNPPVPDVKLGPGGFAIDQSGTCHGDLNACTDYFYQNWLENNPPLKQDIPFKDAIAQQLGVTTYGYQAPKEYWSSASGASAKREAYDMGLDPRLTDAQLNLMWVLIKNARVDSKGKLDFMPMLPRGGVGDWLQQIENYYGPDAAREVRKAFCTAVTNDENCSLKWLQDKIASWINTGKAWTSKAIVKGLKEAAAVIFNTLFDLPTFLLDLNTMQQANDAIVKWAEALSKKKCGKSGDLIICGNLPALPGRSGTTVGGVFLTSYPLSTVLKNKNLISHETVHVYQWWQYYKLSGRWWAFAVYYWMEGTNPCTNKYEKDAGLVAGGYGTQCGLT
ncbi:RHS repeat-associated core domain-containing protein [Microbispora sp. NPDC049125]|uniref:RHS repeat-associated core domain-containing protein n=1 Tax=Microbispora sp. NPDC049125 TaxID=3154929 RepID=UPI003467E347